MFFPMHFIAATKEYTTHDTHVNAPYFRKVFTFIKGKNAKIRICGLGFYELYINGKNVTKGRLAPYITNPDEALYYDEYDVTENLLDGENVIGVWLGNGFQNNPYGDIWDFDKAAFRSAPKMALALFVDGEAVLESDESFLTKPSPITFDDLRAGEHYDARLETAGWNTLGLDERDWQPAIFATTPTGAKKLVEAEPITVHEEIKPISVQKTPKGAHLYNFGVNFTGVCRLKIRGERGQQVKLTYGETTLNGELDLRNIVISTIGLRKDYDHCDWYILKGDGVEYYTPRFTYHGFQFVSVEGLTDEQATLDLLTFEVMHSAVESVGDFRCSDGVLNQIQESVRRSDLSNLFYIPTDCPHREKNGWTGDAALSAEQMLLNFNVKKTFEDWLFSVRNAQNEHGAIPGIVPTGGWGFAWGAGPNWDDVLFELTYQIYRYSGDEQVILDNIGAMETYLRYMQTKKNEDGLFCYGLGDWCQPFARFQPTTPVELTDGVKCIDICNKTAQMAKVVGDTALAAMAEEMASEITRAFRTKYIRDGKLTVLEQTALAYVLYYHIADDCKEALKAQLLDCIAEKNDHFATGVLGARTLFRVLADLDEADLAYKLIMQPDCPSYAQHVRCGARTMFEAFYPIREGAYADGEWWRENGEPHDSLNHHFFGDVSAWFIAYVTGIKINPDFNAPNAVKIAPNFLAELSFAEGEYTHKNGQIRVRWDKLEDGDVRLQITLPCGVEGGLRLPKGYVCEKTDLRAGKQEILAKKVG